jgi:hypothetical protein
VVTADCVAASHHMISAVEMIGSHLVQTVTRHSWQQACSPESMPRHAGNIFTNRCWCRGGVAGPPSCPIPRGLMRDDQEECSLQTTSRTSWISPRLPNEPYGYSRERCGRGAVATHHRDGHHASSGSSPPTPGSAAVSCFSLDTSPHLEY